MNAIERHRKSNGQSVEQNQPTEPSAETNHSSSGLSAIQRHELAKQKKPVLPTATHEPENEVLSREYEVLKQLVNADHQRLKNMPDDGDNHRKDKAKLLNNYRDYLTGWMQSGEKHNNDVLFFNAVWAADVGEWDWLIKLTDYAVETGQTNTIFKSNAESVAAREIFFAAERLNKDGVELMPCFFYALEKIQTDVWVVPTAIKAKFYKLAGIDAQAKNNLEAARDFYQEADDIYPNVAVKGRLKDVKELLLSPSTNSPSTEE